MVFDKVGSVIKQTQAVGVRLVKSSVNMSCKKRIAGAAIIEFIVSLVFIAPVFVLFPYLAKYLSVKQVNIQASRYALWEKTIWSSYPEQWKDGENSKHDRQLSEELNQRFFHDQKSSIDKQPVYRNRFWVDNVGRKITVQGNTSMLYSNNNYSPVRNDFSDRLAYEGFDEASLRYNPASGICRQDNDLNTVNGMQLGAETFTRIKVISATRNLFKRFHENGSPISFSSEGGILANTWSVSSRELYQRRVSGLVLDQTVLCHVRTARLLAKLPIYKEAKMSRRDTLWLPENISDDVQP